MERKSRKRIRRLSAARSSFASCVYPEGICHSPCPEAGSGLRDQGQSWTPKAPRVFLWNVGALRERRACEARQAAQSGDVSREVRSLPSSPSAGEPRTWRREAVDECSA